MGTLLFCFGINFDLSHPCTNTCQDTLSTLVCSSLLMRLSRCKTVFPPMCKYVPTTWKCVGTSFDPICNSLFELCLRAAHRMPQMQMRGIMLRLIFYVQNCTSAHCVLQVNGPQRPHKQCLSKCWNNGNGK